MSCAIVEHKKSIGHIQSPPNCSENIWTQQNDLNSVWIHNQKVQKSLTDAVFFLSKQQPETFHWTVVLITNKDANFTSHLASSAVFSRHIKQNPEWLNLSDCRCSEGTWKSVAQFSCSGGRWNYRHHKQGSTLLGECGDGDCYEVCVMMCILWSWFWRILLATHVKYSVVCASQSAIAYLTLTA